MDALSNLSIQVKEYRMGYVIAVHGMYFLGPDGVVRYHLGGPVDERNIWDSPKGMKEAIAEYLSHLPLYDFP